MGLLINNYHHYMCYVCKVWKKFRLIWMSLILCVVNDHYKSAKIKFMPHSVNCASSDISFHHLIGKLVGYKLQEKNFIELVEE